MASTLIPVQVPPPNIPIAGTSTTARTWLEFFRSLSSAAGQFPTANPADNPTPITGQSTIYAGHLYVCLGAGVWTEII